MTQLTTERTELQSQLPERKTVMDAAKNSILGERKFRLMNQRDMEKLNEDYHTEKYLRHQQIHETLDLLALFEKLDTAKLVREVAIALMGGRYVNLPCAGGGSVSSETGWEDGRKKDEENEDFQLRCWLHAAKTVKASRYVLTKRKGYGNNLLFIEHSHLIGKSVRAFFIRN